MFHQLQYLNTYFCSKASNVSFEFPKYVPISPVFHAIVWWSHTNESSGLALRARGGQMADCFREHLQDVDNNDTDVSKPVACHFNLRNHSHHNMTICWLSLHHGNTENPRSLEQKSSFQLGTLSPQGINESL